MINYWSDRFSLSRTKSWGWGWEQLPQYIGISLLLIKRLSSGTYQYKILRTIPKNNTTLRIEWEQLPQNKMFFTLADVKDECYHVRELCDYSFELF